jgi:hypothetical protein
VTDRSDRSKERRKAFPTEPNQKSEGSDEEKLKEERKRGNDQGSQARTHDDKCIFEEKKENNECLDARVR